MTLARVQADFQAAVLHGTADIETQLAGRDRADFADRLAAYTRGYRSRLVEAMGITYPGLRALLGEPEFELALLDYIEDHPSTHYSIRYYGAGLAAHVRARYGGAECDAALACVAGDLALLEWTLAEVFDAADDEPLALSELARIPPGDWARVSFTPRACVRRLTLASNAVAYWRAQSDGEPAPERPEALAPRGWLLWRRELRTLYRSLAPDEATALDAVLGGASFGTLCEQVAGEVGAEQAPLRAASLLRGWLEEGLIGAASCAPAEG